MLCFNMSSFNYKTFAQILIFITEKNLIFICIAHFKQLNCFYGFEKVFLNYSFIKIKNVPNVTMAAHCVTVPN